MRATIPIKAAAEGDWSEKQATCPYTNHHPTVALPNNMGRGMLYVC